MVKRKLLTIRLEKLQEYLIALKTVQKAGLQRFKEDALVRGAGERYLQLSIECLLDIGNHIIRNYVQA